MTNKRSPYRLRALFAEMGYSGVSAFIASGNVVFSSDAADVDSLSDTIEHRLADRLGYEVETFIRAPAECRPQRGTSRCFGGWSRSSMSDKPWVTVFALAVVLSPTCGDAPPAVTAWQNINAGMSREAVEEVLGEPSDTDLIVKQTESIWGPQEAWWHEVAMGDTLQTWSYEIPGEGTFALYFLADSDTVSFTAFMPEGVVY